MLTSNYFLALVMHIIKYFSIEFFFMINNDFFCVLTGQPPPQYNQYPPPGGAVYPPVQNAAYPPPMGAHPGQPAPSAFAYNQPPPPYSGTAPQKQ